MKEPKNENNDVNNEVVYSSDVEITKAKILPEHIAYEVGLQGNVVGDKKQSFNITVNYKTNEASNFGMSPELVVFLEVS